MHSVPDKETKNGSEAWEGKVDLWKPLNCLVEVANRSKSSKFSSQGSAGKCEQLHSVENEGHARKTKMKEHGQKSKIQEDKNANETTQQDSERPKKFRKIRQKKAPAFGEFNVSPQAVLDGISARSEKRTNPIWFSLVAAKDQ